MKIGLVSSIVLASALITGTASAQSGNPFMPPQGGMNRDQIQQIVRQEIEKARASAGTSPTKSGTTGQPGTPQIRDRANGLPNQQGGSPNASTASGGAGGSAPKADDPVADLLKEGGSFIGCVGGTPVFKDKVGRRAYFTTKELRESNEARRFARCS